MTLWWCPSCGIVWVAEQPPVCKHGTNIGHAPKRMEQLPSWHPYARVAA